LIKTYQNQYKIHQENHQAQKCTLQNKKSNFFYKSLPFDTPVSNKTYQKKKKKGQKSIQKPKICFKQNPKGFFFFGQKPIQTHRKIQELK
jgi:hypothetical protein